MNRLTSSVFASRPMRSSAPARRTSSGDGLACWRSFPISGARMLSCRSRDRPPATRRHKMCSWSFHLAAKGQPSFTERPKTIDADIIHRGTKTRPQQEPSENEPGFLMLDRVATASHALLQARPEGANENKVPLGFRRAEDCLQTLDQSTSRQFVAFAQWLLKQALDSAARSVEGVGRDLWLRVDRRL